MALKPLQEKQLERYGQDVLDFIRASKLLNKYISRKATRSTSTAVGYKSKLTQFGYFIFSKVDGNVSFDTTINKIAGGEINALDLVADYASYLTTEKAKANTIRAKVKLARRFLKFSGVDIDVEDFREQVSLPRLQRPEFKALEKTEVVELLSITNSCSRCGLALSKPSSSHPPAMSSIKTNSKNKKSAETIDAKAESVILEAQAESTEFVCCR